MKRRKYYFVILHLTTATIISSCLLVSCINNNSNTNNNDTSKNPINNNKNEPTKIIKNLNVSSVKFICDDLDVETISIYTKFDNVLPHVLNEQKIFESNKKNLIDEILKNSDESIKNGASLEFLNSNFENNTIKLIIKLSKYYDENGKLKTNRKEEIITLTGFSKYKDNNYSIELIDSKYVIKGKQQISFNQTLTIPYGVDIVSNNAFENYDKIPKINLPNSIYEIGDYSFSGCSELNEINFPNKLTKIGISAFDLSKIETLVIPENVIRIGRFAFSNLTKLKSVFIKTKYVKNLYFDKNIFGITKNNSNIINEITFENKEVMEHFKQTNNDWKNKIGDDFKLIRN